MIGKHRRVELTLHALGVVFGKRRDALRKRIAAIGDEIADAALKEFEARTKGMPTGWFPMADRLVVLSPPGHTRSVIPSVEPRVVRGEDEILFFEKPLLMLHERRPVPFLLKEDYHTARVDIPPAKVLKYTALCADCQKVQDEQKELINKLNPILCAVKSEKGLRKQYPELEYLWPKVEQISQGKMLIHPGAVLSLMEFLKQHKGKK